MGINVTESILLMAWIMMFLANTSRFIDGAKNNSPSVYSFVLAVTCGVGAVISVVKVFA